MRRLVRALAMAGVLLSGSAVAQDDEHQASIKQMGYLAGDWSEIRDGVTVEEHWTGPVGGVMAGVSITHSEAPGSKTMIEFMWIEMRDGKLTFFARPGGAPATAFTLKEADNGTATFESLEHDFPQRVTYEIGEDLNVLNALIEGTVAGKLQAMSWSYEKIAR